MLVALLGFVSGRQPSTEISYAEGRPGKSVVADQAASRYPRMRPSHRLVRSTVTVAGGVADGPWSGVGGRWLRALVEGLVRPMLVVVLEVVAHESFELAAVPDDLGAVRGRFDPVVGEDLPHTVVLAIVSLS